MKRFDNGRVQEKLLDRLEKKEKRNAFQRDRFFKFKLPEIQSRLTQALLMEKIVETEGPSVVSDLIGKGLKTALRANEFDFKYFIAPIRGLIPRPNPISLYMTQYVLEVLINDPSVIEVYGTDQEIYKVVNDVITQINAKFERAEKEILEHLARNKSLTPGSRDYDIALEQAFLKRMGEPHKQHS
ncbi:MAG: DUF507 family protein [Deltaproteobacteria bacterium]|nr:DUF507 family protein [Deltaproteobacteria bacterium]